MFAAGFLCLVVGVLFNFIAAWRDPFTILPEDYIGTLLIMVGGILLTISICIITWRTLP